MYIRMYIRMALDDDVHFKKNNDQRSGMCLAELRSVLLPNINHSGDQTTTKDFVCTPPVCKIYSTYM